MKTYYTEGKVSLNSNNATVCVYIGMELGDLSPADYVNGLNVCQENEEHSNVIILSMDLLRSIPTTLIFVFGTSKKYLFKSPVTFKEIRAFNKVLLDLKISFGTCHCLKNKSHIHSFPHKLAKGNTFCRKILTACLESDSKP